MCAFPVEDGVDFFDGVDGFFAPSVTIFCVVCRKGVQNQVHDDDGKAKERKRETTGVRERERERETKRARFIGRFQTSFASFLVVFGTPSTPEREREREREKTEREREEGSDFVLIRFLE